MEDEESENSNEIKSNKKRLISFAKINKYFIFPFLCPIFCFSAEFFRTKILYGYINDIITDLSYIIGGIPFIILFIRNKKSNKNDSYSNRMTLINKYKSSNKDNKNNSSKKWLIIILICLLYDISRCNIFVNIYYYEYTIEGYLYYLFFIPLFSKLILKQEIYKHQYLSLTISIIAWILANIESFIGLQVDDIIPIIIDIILYSANSLALVLIKYVYNNYFISQYKLSLILGIFFIPFDFFIDLIYSLVRYYIKK